MDFFLSKQRDVRAAKTLFRHALLKHGDPLSITLDAYAASHRAVKELKDSGDLLPEDASAILRLPEQHD